MNNNIRQLQLNHFNKSDDDMYIGNSMAITDNFDCKNQIPDKQFAGYGRLVFPQKLSFIATIICVEGNVESIVNREKVWLRRGDTLIAFSGSIIEGLICRDDTQTVAIAIEDNLGQSFFNRADKVMRSRLTSQTGFVSFHIGEDDLGFFCRQYINAKHLYSISIPPFRDDVVQAFMMGNVALFFSRLVGNIVVSTSVGREAELYSMFMKNLQKYACQHRTVDFYADRLCVSAKYLSRVIRKSSGRSPSQLIQERVTLEAKSLLATSTLTVRQIADEMNFSSDNHFCQYFKKQTGLTPMEYRNAE